MQDGDTLQRFIFENFPVRGYLVYLGASWRALIEHHPYPEVVRNALGEAVAATMLLSATVKYEGTLTLQVQGPGPMHLLVVQATERRAVRGVARWRGEIKASSLPELSGEGKMTVTVENSDHTSRYQGIIPITGTTLAESFEEYFRSSEQLPTKLWLATNGDGAAGLLLQRLPSGSRASAEENEDIAAEGDEDWSRVVQLAATLTPAELMGLTSVEFLHRLFHEEDVRLHEPDPVFFQCTCSRERVTNIVRSLGSVEAAEILAERDCVEIICEFCNRAWRFDAVDVASIFVRADLATVPKVIQ